MKPICYLLFSRWLIVGGNNEVSPGRNNRRRKTDKTVANFSFSTNNQRQLMNENNSTYSFETWKSATSATEKETIAVKADKKQQKDIPKKMRI